MSVAAGEGGAARESPLRGRVLPWVVVALLLLGTMLAVALILAQERRQSRDDREDVAAQTLERLEGAVDAQVLGLRGVAATAAAEPLSNAGFARISEAPLSAGLEAVAWLPRVDPGQREAVERAAGAPIVQPDGAGGLRTAGDQPVYYPATLIARAEGPGAAPRVGLDHWSITERRRAMSAASASGEVRATGETTVDGVGSGMLLYVPVIGGGGAPVGFVAGSLSAAELQALAGRDAPDGADVDVVLGPGAAEGAAGAKGVAVGDIAGTPVRVIVGGLGASLWLPLIILVVGLGVAALVAALFVLAASREREGTRAAEMVAQERDYSEAIVSSIQDGLLVLDENLSVRSVNVRFEEITGFREDELVGEGPPFPFLSAQESDRLGDIVEEVRVLGVGEFDLGLVDRDGEEIPAILSLSATVAGTGSLVGFVGTVKDITARKRTEQRLRDREAENRALAAQHEAIRRVATAVAREKDPEEVFALIARQALAITGGDVGGVARAPESRSGEVVAWRAHGNGPVTEQVQLSGEDEPIAVALQGDDPAMGRIDALRAGQADQGGARAAIAAPIRAGGSLWGVVFAETNEPGRMTREVEEGIESLAELAALAIMNDDARRRLESQATTDPLTGLANRRAFDDRLRLEVIRAERHGRPLSLVLLDLDHFKMVNDAHGHQLGDKVLVETANRLTQLARVGDLVARIGGEEFAWILTETDGAGAEVAAERARRIVRDEPFAGVGSLTISLGACSLDIGGDAERLLRFADTALYHAKERGRDRVHLYVPSDGTDAPLAASRSSIARARAQDGLRSLVRGIEETSDPRALPRSDRVAELAAAIASDLGWEATRVVRLREAALLHDIGWVAVPPDVRARRGPLTTDQRLIIRDHVDHGAMIAAGVLDEEQVSWIRFHHERWDGGGYPDGLVGEVIPDGARIIAVADAWVAMTSPREYRPTLSGPRALEEFRAEASAQFAPEAVDALERVMASTDSGVTSVPT